MPSPKPKPKPKTKCKFCHKSVAEKDGRWGARQVARHYCPHGERCTGGEGPGYYADPRRSGSCVQCMSDRQAEQTVARVHTVHSLKFGVVRLQAEHVRCGKPTCKRCQKGVGHGPYWRGYATPSSLGSRTADMAAGARRKRVSIYLGLSEQPPSVADVEKKLGAKLAGRAKAKPKR
jgi:hypothetical protein